MWSCKLTKDDDTLTVVAHDSGLITITSAKTLFQVVTTDREACKLAEQLMQAAAFVAIQRPRNVQVNRRKFPEKDRRQGNPGPDRRKSGTKRVVKKLIG